MRLQPARHCRSTSSSSWHCSSRPTSTVACAMAPPPTAAQPVHNGNGTNGADQQPYPLIMMPLRQTKTIHFIRHGQGFHNVAGHANHDSYKSEEWYEWFDSHLTAEGWKQADDLNRHILASGLKVDLVVVSPMMRALETAVGAFGRQALGASGKALMAARPEDKGHSVARPAVSTEGAPPFIAHEMAREIYGQHPCDRRRTTSEYRSLFPGIDWSFVTEENDVLWHVDQRESKASVIERGRKLLQFLMQGMTLTPTITLTHGRRPESSIAVVTHSTLLHYTVGSFGLDFSTAVQGELHRWFENCEMRSVVLANLAETLPADKYHHPGGAPPPSH